MLFFELQNYSIFMAKESDVAFKLNASPRIMKALSLAEQNLVCF